MPFRDGTEGQQGTFRSGTYTPTPTPQAAPEDKFAHGEGDNAHPNLWNVVHGLVGGYQEAASNGLMMEPVRAAMEATGYGMDKVKQLYPGQTDEFYRTKLHEHYNQAVTNARTNSHQMTQDNLYPGHQVANFAASVLGSADPTWFINPGGSIENQLVSRGVLKAASPLARVGLNAGVHAGMNTAADAAAQGMDIAEGQKKDFDVERNLTAAAFGGAFGAAHAGAGELAAHPVVSDFVKGLFKTRGVDTTPGADPRGITTPLTSAEGVRFSPAEQAQFKTLLKTGSVDDIKQFFRGKNGAQPTWSDVNNIVKFRDTMPENYVGKNNLHQALDEHLDDQHKSIVNDHISATTQDWKNAPDFEVINHVNEIADPAVREQAIKENAGDPNALGFLGADGKVRIFANRMESPEMLNSVIYHEGLGHHGLQQKFGDKLDSTIQTLLDRNVGSLNGETDKWLKQNPGAYGGDRVRAAEEVLANASNGGRIKSSWSDALTSTFRQFGRKMGLKLSYSDAEVGHILSMAHDAVINGKGRDVTSNGFRGTNPGLGSKAEWAKPEPTNKFMTRDQMEPALQSEFSKWSEGTHPELLDENGEHKTIYHGSPNHIKGNEFNRNRINGKYETYATSDPTTAETYHDHNNEHDYLDYSKVLQARRTFMKQQQAYMEMLHQTEPGSPERDKLEDWIASKYDEKETIIRAQKFAPGGRTYPLHANFKNPKIIDDLQGKKWSPSRFATRIEAAKAAGHDSVIFKNVEDHGSSGLGDRAGASDVYVSLKQGQYKSATDFSKFQAEGNKFMRKADLAASSEYHIQQMEHAYNATDRDYTPTFRSFDDVKQDALKAGFNNSQIKAMGKGPDISKRLFRIQAAAKVLDMRISDTLKKVDTPEWSEGDKENLRQMLVDHSYVLSKLRDERAEAARALNMSKLGYTRTQMESFGELLKERGGTLGPLGDDDTLLKFARQLKTLSATGNPAGMNAMVSALNKPNWEDYLTTLHQNMMLSALSTHVKAPVDMMIGIGRELMDTAGALPMSAGREALSALGVKVKPGVHPTEVAARLWGVLKAGLDASTYANTVKTFANGGVNPNGFGGKQNARIPGVSKVTDLISAQDAFFRAFATNMHLYGLGTRKAMEDARLAGTPKDWDTIMNTGSNYARTPSKAMLEEAKAAANQTLLLNKNALTEPLDRLKATTPQSSGLRRFSAFVANFLTPFIRVESNSLINRVIRRSPLAFLDPQTIRDLKTGGARADIAMSRIAMGTASIAAYWMAAGKGKLTGEGPDNVDKKKQMEAGGWRPGAVHENGQYNTGNKLAQSLNPFDVHNSTATMVAGLRDAYDQGANKGQVGTGLKLAILSSLKSLADMSWVSDIAPAVDAITSPNRTMEQKATSFVSDEAQTMLPNAMSQVARVGDQNQVDTQVSGHMGESIVNSLKANVPGLKETLPVHYSVYGTPLQTGASFAGTHTYMPQDNRVTAGNHTDETHDPAERELDRLNSLIAGSLITPVQKTVTTNKQKIKLTNEQFEEYQHLAGRAIVETVKQEMGTPKWQKMSDQQKVLEVKDIQKDMKKAAKEHLYGE